MEPRRCPHGCLNAQWGHSQPDCPLGRSFPPTSEPHDQSVCTVCTAYFEARGERVPEQGR